MSYPPPGQGSQFPQEPGFGPAASKLSGKTLWIIVGAVIAVIVLVCCGGLGVVALTSEDEPESSSDSERDADDPAPTVTVEQTVTETPTEEEPAVSEADAANIYICDVMAGTGEVDTLADVPDSIRNQATWKGGFRWIANFASGPYGNYQQVLRDSGFHNSWETASAGCERKYGIATEELEPLERKPRRPPADDPDTFPMPNEVGMVLQDAQDHMQQLADNPFFVTFSEDATGEDRFQVLDDGWQVCGQDPAPGTPVRYDNSDDITFYVVRLTETCP